MKREDKMRKLDQIERKEKRNLVDTILTSVITRFVTKDEWHTIIIGFFDGLSFSMQGKWHRKAIGNPNLNVEGIDTEKSWYYRVPYVFGEIAKVILVLMLVEHFGLEIVALVVGA